jgi:DNA/RNA-binding domain of Phe-tRNA-synthetase-like protein
MRKIIVSPAVYKKFPDFVCGIVIVKDIQIAQKNKRIKKPLNKMIEQRKAEGQDLINHPYLKAWDEAHRRFGSDPEQYLPSIKSLLTRIMSGGGLPFINSVVTIFNYISIKYLVPCGGDDIKKISGNLCLDFATGEESFVGLGSTEVEHPEKGEVIYYDDMSKQIMCRRWNWRNAEFSKISDDTKEIVINVDGIEGIPTSVIIEARDELASLLQEHCAAILRTDLLTEQNQKIPLPD